MARRFNITGHWAGNYEQQGHSRPIEADLVQTRERLTGSMRDAVTDTDRSVTEVALEENLPPGGDEQIVDRLRRLFPDAPATEVRYVTHLPPDSGLEGWIEGMDIYFLKTYAGTCYGGYLIGDKLVGHEDANHSVHYGGRLSPDGNEIEGKWWIGDDPADGRQRGQGAFRLQRRKVAERPTGEN